MPKQAKPEQYEHTQEEWDTKLKKWNDQNQIVTNSRDGLIFAAYVDGISINRIHTQMGIGRDTIYRTLRALGIEPTEN